MHYRATHKSARNPERPDARYSVHVDIAGGISQEDAMKQVWAHIALGSEIPSISDDWIIEGPTNEGS